MQRKIYICLSTNGTFGIIAPSLLEDIYNFQDALVTASMLMCLLRHCDRVKIGCLAQLVNVIAPIFTETGGKMFKQTIFYPFAELAHLADGTVRDIRVQSETYDTEKHKNVPYLDAVAGEKDGKLLVFAVNRSLEEEICLSVDTTGENWRLIGHKELYHDDLNAENTFDCERVCLCERAVEKDIRLKKHSFNALTFEKV